MDLTEVAHRPSFKEHTKMLIRIWPETCSINVFQVRGTLICRGLGTEEMEEAWNKSKRSWEGVHERWMEELSRNREAQFRKHTSQTGLVTFSINSQEPGCRSQVSRWCGFPRAGAVVSIWCVPPPAPGSCVSNLVLVLKRWNL